MKVSANDERGFESCYGDPICTYILYIYIYYIYIRIKQKVLCLRGYIYTYIYMCVCAYPCVYAYVCEYSVRALIYSVTLSLYCPEIDRN